MGGTLPLFILGVIGVLTAAAFYAAKLAPIDTLMYFNTATAAHFYGSTWGAGSDSLFVYPPPFLYAIRLLSFAGWGGWLLLWTVVLSISYAPLRWVGVVAVIVGFVLRSSFAEIVPIAVPGSYLFIGNLQPLIMASIVLGLRYPAGWAIPLLTKIGPGIGILWFAVRREWRSLGIAVATTAAFAAVAFVIDPSAWSDWLRFVIGNLGTPSPIPVSPVPGIVRFPVAVVLIVWGARTDRPWTLPIACGIASFALYEWSYLTVWLGALAFVGPWAPRDADGRPSFAGPRLRRGAAGPPEPARTGAATTA